MHIKNYQNMIDKLGCLGPWAYEEIVEIKYNIEQDYEDNYITVLDLTFKVEVIKTRQCFKLKKRYYNVSNFSLEKVTNLYLTNSLIIHDKKELGWDSDKRYHVHDDSGYGENDGYNFIEFYCSSIEALSLEEFYSTSA